MAMVNFTDIRLDQIARVNLHAGDRRWPIAFLCKDGVITSDGTKNKKFQDQPVESLIRWATGKFDEVGIFLADHTEIRLDRFGNVKGLQHEQEREEQPVTALKSDEPELYGSW